MPTLYNVDHQPAVVDPNEVAVMPGESHEFTDEQVAAGLGGLWSEQDPRKGLAAEQVFKERRDVQATAPAAPANTDLALPEETQI